MYNLKLFAIEVFILTLLLLILSFTVIRIRRKEKIAVGVDGSQVLTRAAAAHSNFINYVPFALILQWILISLGLNLWWVSILAGLLVLGRIFHCISVLNLEIKQQPTYLFRGVGMIMTFSSILLSATLLLCIAFYQ